MKKYLLNISVFLSFFYPFFANAHSASQVVFSPYVDLTLSTHWDTRYEALEPIDLTLISEPTHIKSYHLAFITDAGTCLPAWGGQPSYSVENKWGVHLTDQLHAHNIDFIVSLGGANGNDLSKACDITQLISSYEHIIDIYHPNGLDFDIENGTAKVDNIMQALQQIQIAHPTLTLSFTLPVMPEGLTAEGQHILQQAKMANLHYAVNIMTMDYGPTYTNDMGQYAIEAATHLFTYLKNLYPEQSEEVLWKMIEVTPMIGINDVNVEAFTLSNADTLRTFAKQNHLNGLSMWSIARDNPCDDQWTSSICSSNHLQTKSYEFSDHFMR